MSQRQRSSIVTFCVIYFHLSLISNHICHNKLRQYNWQPSVGNHRLFKGDFSFNSRGVEFQSSVPSSSYIPYYRTINYSLNLNPNIRVQIESRAFLNPLGPHYRQSSLLCRSQFSHFFPHCTLAHCNHLDSVSLVLSSGRKRSFHNCLRNHETKPINVVWVWWPDPSTRFLVTNPHFSVQCIHGKSNFMLGNLISPLLGKTHPNSFQFHNENPCQNRNL